MVSSAAIKCKHCGEFIDPSDSPQAVNRARNLKVGKWLLVGCAGVLLLGLMGLGLVQVNQSRQAEAAAEAARQDAAALACTDAVSGSFGVGPISVAPEAMTPDTTDTGYAFTDVTVQAYANPEVRSQMSCTVSDTGSGEWSVDQLQIDGSSLYATIDEVHEAAVAAGLSCPDFKRFSSIAAWCSRDGAVSIVFENKASQESRVKYERGKDGTLLLVGPGWMIRIPVEQRAMAEQVQAQMGGEILE